MTKDKLNKLMKKIDRTKKPKHWIKFINENTKQHNIILKCGKRAFCTHCQKYFDEQVIVHSYRKAKCPHCENEYYVRNCNVQNFLFCDDVAFYTKVDNQIILRVFEIKSTYDTKKRKFTKSLQEFLRFIPNIGVITNNTISTFMWYTKIYHNIKKIVWHIYNGNKSIGNPYIYPYDEKELFKGTVYEYAPLKEFKQKYGYYNEFEILQMAGYQSFELLWKMGLYNLSKDAKHFNKKGSFVKRFGISKSFLQFMVDNNLNYEQYRILKLIQKTDMELINDYKRYDYNYLVFMKKQGYIMDRDVVHAFYSNENTLRVICRYVPLRKFLNYKKGLNNMKIYADYLTMLKKLNYNMKSSKELYPKQLVASHDKLMKKIEIMNDIKTQFGVYLRYYELSKYTYDNGKYIIYPAPSVDDFKDESEQQENCVARVYIKPYIDGITEIYFIRQLDNVTKSFITLEYKNNEIVQKELPHHSRDFDAEQLEFMDNWLKFRAFMDKKDENKSKTKKQTIKYDLAKIAA